MAPSSLAVAMGKTSQPVRTSSQDSDNIRKRVCKACDRCRLKKSKCDGSNPCTRCKADNAICVFGERKKSQDKVYPKGYVEMLEQQQGQLVSALQEMYRRANAGQRWTGPVLQEVSGQPLTHDILAALNLLEVKHDGTGKVDTFEEDYDKLQSRLLADGAGYMQQRRGSLSSESEHSQYGQTHARSVSKDFSGEAKLRGLRKYSASSCASPSLPHHSPVDVDRPRLSAARPQQSSSEIQISSGLCNDPQLYSPEWYIPDMTSQASKQRYALLTTEYDEVSPEVDAIFDTDQFNMSFEQDYLPTSNYPQQFTGAMGTSNMPMMQDFGLDPMDLELNRFVPVTT
nr:fluconazole resistance protein 1 [Quercus suber]